MPIAGVGFDLDYTLCVPDRDRQTLLDEATERVDAPPLDRGAYLDAHRRHLTDRTREPVFADLLAERDTEASSADLAGAYREAVNDAIVPVAGARSLLSALRREYRVGLLTNGPWVAQREKLDALGWEDAFDAVVVSGDLEAGKPDPAAFEALLSALGTAPGETVYVGDDVEADVHGASEAGLLTVQVRYPGGPDLDPRADRSVERDDLAAALPGVLASFDGDARRTDAHDEGAGDGGVDDRRPSDR